MYADTYTVRLGLFGWGRKDPEPERLFQPPAEVAERRDSIDAAIEADRAHLTPGRRVGLGVLSVLSLASSGNGALTGQAQTEVVKLWGTDRYVPPSKAGR